MLPRNKTEIKDLFDKKYKNTTDYKQMKLSRATKEMSGLLKLPESTIKNYVKNNKGKFVFKHRLTTNNKINIRNIFNSKYRDTKD